MVVVILGHRLTAMTIHAHLQQRIDTGINVLRNTDTSYLLCSGGQGNGAIPRTEGDVMREYALAQGVADERILVEARSVDTIGNAYFTRRLLANQGIELDTLVLVTADYHLPRATYIFEQCFGDAVTIEPAACETSISERLDHDESRLEQARAFFEPITPGDLEMIKQRLVDEHDYYPPTHTIPSP